MTDEAKQAILRQLDFQGLLEADWLSEKAQTALATVLEANPGFIATLVQIEDAVGLNTFFCDGAESNVVRLVTKGLLQPEALSAEKLEAINNLTADQIRALETVSERVPLSVFFKARNNQE